MAGKNILEKKILKIFKNLFKENVPYVIIGGMAMVFHGIPRTTLDIDIIVSANKKVLIKLFSILKKNGLKIMEKNILKLLERPDLIAGQWITFSDEKDREIIDVFLEDENEFEKIFKKAERKKGNNTVFYVAPLQIIKKMKTISNRPIDIADIVLIKERLDLDKKS